MADMWVEFDHRRPIAAILYHRRLGMIVGGTLKESFVGFVHFFLVWCVCDWILEVGCEIFNVHVVDKRT